MLLSMLDASFVGNLTFNAKVLDKIQFILYGSRDLLLGQRSLQLPPWSCCIFSSVSAVSWEKYIIFRGKHMGWYNPFLSIILYYIIHNACTLLQTRKYKLRG